MLRVIRDPIGRIARLWADEVRAIVAGPGRLALAGRILLIWLIETGGLLVLARVVPGLRVDGPLPALGVVILLQVLYAAVRPILVYLLLPLLIVTLGLLSVVVNAALLLVAESVVPGVRIGGFGSAVLTVVGLALVNLVVVTVLDLGEEGSFYRRVGRRLVRRGRAPLVIERPGYLFVQVDGLGHDVVAEGVRTGRMPTIERWIRGGTHRLLPWECGLPSQTSASQAGLLFGDNHAIPAFRWYEKASRRLLVSNRPADAAEIERRLAAAPGLLSRNGSSIGNLLSGGAMRTVLTMSTVADLGPGIPRRSRDFLVFFLNPYAATRVLFGMAWQMLLEVWEGRRQARRGVWPRIDRRGAFPFLRAASCVLLHDLAVTLLIEDMARGVAATYADLVGYDEVAHHAGPERPESLTVLERVDRSLADLERASASASRPYRIIVLSDHGQSQGATFRQRHGMPLDAIIRALMRGEPSVAAATAPVEGWGHVNAFLSELLSGGPLLRLVRRGLGRSGHAGWVELGPGSERRRPPGSAGDTLPAEPAELVVCASGNLALVYFTGLEGRATLEAVEARYPGLVEGLARTAWIGFVMVATADAGPVAVGPAGRRWLADGRIEGEDPLVPFGPLAADHLRRLDGFPNVGDLLVNSAVDRSTGEVAAFEELVGSHGGLGGGQTRPFVLAPVELPLPEKPMIGAPAVGALLRRWVEDAGPVVTPAAAFADGGASQTEAAGASAPR